MTHLCFHKTHPDALNGIAIFIVRKKFRFGNLVEARLVCLV